MSKEPKFKRLFVDIEPYYRLEIDEDGIRVKSFSKYRGGLEKTLSQYFSVDKGYLRVKMNNKHKLIHQLVAKYCIGDKPIGDYVIDHIDGNKLNNYPHNLRYVTRAENTSLSVSQGLHVSNFPEKHAKYIDGRCRDIVSYKHSWYTKNRERILAKSKQKYFDSKKTTA